MCEMLNLAARSFIIVPYVNVEGRKSNKLPYLLAEATAELTPFLKGQIFPLKGVKIIYTPYTQAVLQAHAITVVAAAGV